MNITLNFDKRNIIIVILLLLLILGGMYHFSREGLHKDEKQQQKNLTNALNDSLKTYRNKEHEWVNEKLTIQAETKELRDKNLVLTNNQKDLINRVDEINKHNQIITAALIQMGVKLDGLVNSKPIIENDSTIKFPEKNDSIEYNIEVFNVKQYGLLKPVLRFNQFSLPNKQLIEFHWKNDVKEGYPISFSVTNSNPYYKVYNLDSYAIPELEKKKIKPTFWNKVQNFSKSTGGKIVLFGAGMLVGGYVLK